MQSSRSRRILASIATAATVAAGLLVVTPAAAAPDAAPLTWSTVNTDFVTRDGTRLMLGGQPFRFNGANIYWLGLDENVGGVDYPTFFRIKDALDTAKELGISVIRSHMMTSTGQNNANPLAIMPALGEYNDDAFATIDFAIAYAASLGLRFILPMTDEWSYYHGGHRDFTTPLGLGSADFYTDPTAIAAFEDYVDHVLSRTNALTGLRYVDDPTILAWELGNELEAMPAGWIERLTGFVKDRAPDQLVAAGRRFDIDPDTLTAAGVDIVDVHYYPPTVDKVTADAETVTSAGKVYIAGEYGSNSASTELLGPLATDARVSGMMLWSLFGHNDRGGFVPHGDGFTLHYPGTTQKMRGQNAAIKAYSEALGFATGTVAPVAPLITEVRTSNGVNSVAWRGVAGANSYLVERSSDGATWGTVATASAEESPILDPAPAGDARYRVTASRSDGASAVSDIVAVPAGAAVLVDPLQSLLLTSAHHGVRIVAGHDGGRAVAEGPAASLTWRIAGAESAVFLLAAPRAADLTVSSSADGSTWTDATVAIEQAGGLTRVSAGGLVGENVRVSWPSASGVELVRATLTGVADRAALVDPLDDFSLTAQHNGALAIDSGNPSQFGGDSGRVKRESGDPASLVWHYDTISGVDFTAWYWPDQPVIPLQVSGSSNGADWVALAPQITGGTGNWKRFDYSLRGLTGLDYVRVSWDGAQGEPWTPQIGQLTLFSPNAAQPAAPGAFGATSPADGTDGVISAPKLSWSRAADAAYYTVVLARDAGLTDVVERSGVRTAPHYSVQAELVPGTTYYWQVTAVNGFGATVGSPAVASFSTARLPNAIHTIEDFEQYADDTALGTAFPRNTGGGPVTAAVDVNPATASRAARFDYDLTGPGYAGVMRTLPTAQSWWGYRGIAFDARATAGQSLTVQFVAAGSYWESVIDVTDDTWQTYSIDFDRFAPPSWAGEGQLDLSVVTQFSFYRGGAGAGTLLVDDVRTVLADQGPSAPVNTVAPSVAGQAEVGGVLTARPGEWDDADALFAYQWQRNGTDIPEASGAAYTVVPADQGATIGVVVTATGAGGVTTAASEPTLVRYASAVSLRLSTPLSLSFVKVKATVQMTTDAATAGRTVTVTVAGKSVAAVLDAHGTATVTLPSLRSGIHTVTVAFAGDAAVAGSTSRGRTLVILF